jgi:mediator of RNA polymerase II transcription subunit 14
MWIASRQPPPTAPGRAPNRSKLPLLGGTLTISILQSFAPPQAGGGPARSPKARVLADLEQKSKFGNAKPSDEAEALKFQVRWEPTKGALSVIIPPEDAMLSEKDLFIVSLFGYLQVLRNLVWLCRTQATWTSNLYYAR